MALCAGSFSRPLEPAVCGNALLILFSPFVQSRSGLWVVWLEKHCSDLAWRSEYLDRAATCPMEVKGNISKGSLAPREFPPSWRAPTVPQPSLYSSSLAFVVRKQLSRSQWSLWRNGSLCMWAYISVCSWRGEFSVLLHHRHLGPHFLFLFF